MLYVVDDLYRSGMQVCNIVCTTKEGFAQLQRGDLAELKLTGIRSRRPGLYIWGFLRIRGCVMTSCSRRFPQAQLCDEIMLYFWFFMRNFRWDYLLQFEIVQAVLYSCIRIWNKSVSYFAEICKNVLKIRRVGETQQGTTRSSVNATADDRGAFYVIYIFYFLQTQFFV